MNKQLADPLQPSLPEYEKTSIALEHLIRGLIKWIPYFGEGLEEAIFGTKDAMEDATTRRILESIHSQVSTLVTESSRPRALTRQQVDKVAASPGLLKLKGDLSKASDETRQELRQFIFHAQRMSGATAQIMESFRSETSETLRAMDTKWQALQAGQTTIQKRLNDSCDRLTKIEATLASSRQPSADELKQLHQTLHHLRTEELSSTGKSIASAAGLGVQNRKITLTVDFADLYNYASAPSSTDPDCAFDVFVFEQTPEPLYLLPGTVEELTAFFKKAHRSVIDATSERSGIGAAGTISAIATDFFNRIADLSKRGRLADWPDQLPLDDDVRSLQRTIYEVLERIRPQSSLNNQIDALNMALVAVLDGRSTDQHVSVAHLSSARTLAVVWENLRHIVPVSTSRPEHASLILHPHAWALNLHYSQSGVHTLPKVPLSDARSLEDLPSLVQDIEQWLRSPSGERLPTLISAIRSTRHALVSVEETTQSFHAKLVDVEKANFPHVLGRGAAVNWKELFEQAQETALSTLSQLLGWIEPLEKRYAPFREFSEEIRKSGMAPKAEVPTG